MYGSKSLLVLTNRTIAGLTNIILRFMVIQIELCTITYDWLPQSRCDTYEEHDKGKIGREIGATTVFDYGMS